MAYKYISENNLYNKQSYMYSEFGGKDFLKEYLNSRQMYLKVHEISSNKFECSVNTTNISDVQRDLFNIKKCLETGKQDRYIMDRLNAYMKSFEVRKRIYSQYDSDWKPIKNIGFEEYAVYLLFAQCMTLSFESTKSLKYFSALLKVDDTLLSIQYQLDDNLKNILNSVLKNEINIFYRLMDENGISLEE